METKKATIRREEKNTYLVLAGIDQSYEIVLTDDNPNNIKSVFNNLLKDLKRGLFIYKLDDKNGDLYSHVCEEYIRQLNVELKAVFDELNDYALLEP